MRCVGGLDPGHCQRPGLGYGQRAIDFEFSKSPDTIYGCAEQFARIVEAATSGKFKISLAHQVRQCPVRVLMLFVHCQRRTKR